MVESVEEKRAVAPARTTGVDSVGRRTDALWLLPLADADAPISLAEGCTGMGVMTGSTDGVCGMLAGSMGCRPCECLTGELDGDDADRSASADTADCDSACVERDGEAALAASLALA